MIVNPDFTACANVDPRSSRPLIGVEQAGLTAFRGRPARVGAKRGEGAGVAGLRLTAIAMSALLLAGAATSVAQAEPARAKPAPQFSFTTRDVFAPDLNQWGASVVRRTLEWDSAKARWGLKLDLEQPLNSASAYRDVQAGAYYKITPSFRVGGAVGVTSMSDDPQPVIPTARTPKVKLETAFKF